MKQDKDQVVVFNEKLNLIKDLDYQVVYMDESGFGYDMPRLFAQSPKGEHAIGYRNNHNKKKTNLVRCLLNKKLIAPILLPQLKTKTAIIMDNASFHKRTDIIEAIHNEVILFYICHLVARN